MKLCWRKRFVPGAIILLGLTTGCSGVLTQPPQSSADSGNSPPFTRIQAVEIPKGSSIYIRLQESISSATAQEGQSFSAVLDDPIVVDGQTIAPLGAPVTGRVVAARQSGHLHDSGYLRLTLSTISLNGKIVPMQTTSLFVKGGSFRNHNLAYIGGGAGGGALLGGFAGGGKGALIGGTLGGGGGAAAAYATGKNEVGFAAEHRLGFRLIETMKIIEDGS
jgi:hypothetical protein